MLHGTIKDVFKINDITLLKNLVRSCHNLLFRFFPPFCYNHNIMQHCIIIIIKIKDIKVKIVLNILF